MPYPFLVYVNDLPSAISYSSAYLFANDTKFIKSITSFNDSVQLQSDIDSLSSWCRTWNLSLNQDKCAVMRLSLRSHTDPHTYAINNSNIKISSNQRDLGAIISHNLSWDTHYSYICANAYRALNFIRRNIALSALQHLKKSLYLSLVRSTIIYCSQLWRPMYISRTSNVLKMYSAELQDSSSQAVQLATKKD